MPQRLARRLFHEPQGRSQGECRSAWRGGFPMSLAMNIALAILFLSLALWTIVARDTFAAVAGFIPYGLLLTLVWLQLSAIDVAMTEAAIGAGLTGALLIGAASRLRKTEAAARAERPGLLTRVLAAILAAAVAA